MTPSSVALATSTLSSPMPGASDDDEVLRRFEHRSIDLGGRADDQGVRPVDAASISSDGESPNRMSTSCPASRNCLQTGVGNLFGYQYTSHEVTFR